MVSLGWHNGLSVLTKLHNLYYLVCKVTLPPLIEAHFDQRPSGRLSSTFLFFLPLPLSPGSPRLLGSSS